MWTKAIYIGKKNPYRGKPSENKINAQVSAKKIRAQQGVKCEEKQEHRRQAQQGKCAEKYS